jgi:hypothetical protein
MDMPEKSGENFQNEGDRRFTQRYFLQSSICRGIGDGKGPGVGRGVTGWVSAAGERTAALEIPEPQRASTSLTMRVNSTGRNGF